MPKLTILTIGGIIFASLISPSRVTAVTVSEISTLVAAYPYGYFTNANTSIKDSFLKSLESIASNIDLFNNGTDPAFKADLGQEIHNGIEELISKTDGCIDESNNPDSNDWLIDCNAQSDIYPKLKELLAAYLSLSQ